MYWDNPRLVLGTGTADAQGSFSQGTAFTFTIPAGPGLMRSAGLAEHPSHRQRLRHRGVTRPANPIKEVDHAFTFHGESRPHA